MSEITLKDLVFIRDQIAKESEKTAKRMEKEARVERAMAWPK